MRRTTKDQVLHDLVAFYIHLDPIFLAGRPRRSARLACTRFNVLSSSAWCTRCLSYGNSSVVECHSGSGIVAFRRVSSRPDDCFFFSWAPVSTYPIPVCYSCSGVSYDFLDLLRRRHFFTSRLCENRSIDRHATANVPAQYHFRRSRTITKPALINQFNFKNAFYKWWTTVFLLRRVHDHVKLWPSVEVLKKNSILKILFCKSHSDVSTTVPLFTRVNVQIPKKYTK